MTHKLLMWFILFSPTLTVAEPQELDSLQLQIDGVDLQLSIFLEGEKRKVQQDGVFLPLFDFTLAKVFIEDSTEECKKKILRREQLCVEHIGRIQKDFLVQIKDLEAKRDACEKKSFDLRKQLEESKSKLLSEKNFYKWVLGGSGAAILGLVVAVIIK